MFRQPALADSALRGLHDELLAYWMLFCDVPDLLALAQVNSVLYVFAREEPLWMLHCLRLHGGDFALFRRSWRLTTLFPTPDRRPKALPEFPPLAIRNFGSDFLYRRWCRSHMQLGDFALPTDPYARQIQRFDVGELSYQTFYEQYARVPFILTNAITKWKASTTWTMDQLVARFAADSSIRHRLTHNLDTCGDRSTEMNFANYQTYLAQQEDETPLYIFDPRFGEKMPSLLEDYNVEDLGLFREDFLRTVREAAAAKGTKTTTTTTSPSGKALDPDFRWLVIGPQRSGAPWHTDPARTSAWNALLQGRKRWALYPPGSPPPGIGAFGKNALGRQQATDMTSLAWYLHVYPTLAPHQRPLELIQEEGEVIYVPSGWWHLVLNLDTTIAVTQNFVDSHNLFAFAQDLLDDRHDHGLQRLQQELRAAGRPETYDVFRLAQIPRMHGFLDPAMYMDTFRVPRHWRPHLKTLYRRHKLPLDVLRNVSTIRSLTARVNPTFAMADDRLVKFYSEFNQDWGEFSFTAYLSPRFDSAESEVTELGGIKGGGGVRAAKRHKTGILAPHELKTAMTLRYAMEEAYRVERSTYEMILRAARDSTGRLGALRTIVPSFYFAGHLHDVSDVDDEDGDGTMWRWPYAIMEYRRGLVGLGKFTKSGLGASSTSWQRWASWVSGTFLPLLHAVPLPGDLRGLYGHSKATWAWYTHYLLHQRKGAWTFHLREDAAPSQLLNDLLDFLPAATHEAIATSMLPQSAAASPPALVHGDLTDENVLGVVLSGEPEVNGVAPAADGRDLAVVLRNAGLDKYVSLLVEAQELTLSTMALVTEPHLEKLGIPLGPRLAILQAVADMPKPLGAARACVDDCDALDSDSDSEDEAEEVQLNQLLMTDEGLEELRKSRQAKFYGNIEWEPRLVIDFADAKTGDPLYDLVAIFFAALHCNRELWAATLSMPYWRAYIWREHVARGDGDEALTSRLLRERFLRLTLLHPSRSIRSLFHFIPSATRLMTWPEVAEQVFGELFWPQGESSA